MTDSTPAADRPPVATAICFDLDGTLVAYDREWSVLIRETLATEYEAVTDEMVETVLSTVERAFDEMEPEPYYRAIAAACELGDAERAAPDAMTEAAVGALVERLRAAELDATTVSETTRDCVATLAADDDVAVCVVADGLPDWQRAKLAHHDLADHVTAVVTSYGSGGNKASGAPYEAIRDQIDAAEYVMIGDDYADDVEAARAAGFVPIHYEDDDGPDFFGTLDALL